MTYKFDNQKPEPKSATFRLVVEYETIVFADGWEGDIAFDEMTEEDWAIHFKNTYFEDFFEYEAPVVVSLEKVT